MRFLWAAFILLATLPGCVIVQVGVTNPIPGLTTVAVAPFFNLSQEPSQVADGRRMALAYYAELQKTPGFQVIPVGVVEEAIEAHGLRLNHPDDALKLCEILRCDAVVIGAITDYDPYYPPRLGVQVSWYSPYAWDFVPGLPLDPHARSRLRKADCDYRKDQFRKAAAERRARRENERCGSGGSDGCDPNSSSEPCDGNCSPQIRGQNSTEVAIEATVQANGSSRPPLSVLPPKPSSLPLWWQGEARSVGQWSTTGESASDSTEQAFGEAESDAEIPASARSQQSTKKSVMGLRTNSPYVRLSATREEQPAPPLATENRRIVSTTRTSSPVAGWSETERPAEIEARTRAAAIFDPRLRPATPAVREVATGDRRISPAAFEQEPRRLTQNIPNDLSTVPPLPPQPMLEPAGPEAITVTPYARPRIAPQPMLVPPGPEAPPEFDPRLPLMSYTRLFDAKDAALMAMLRDYLELSGDQRSGGWEGSLHRSEDFLRFCAHQLVLEMLTLHGGEAQKRLVLKFRTYR